MRSNAKGGGSPARSLRGVRRRAHFLQHVPFEGPGSIEPWLKTVGFETSKTLFFESAAVPNPGDLDFLVVLGGPLSVNDEKEFPWLVDEKVFIRSCIEGGKTVLGVCLGAQLIASALGSPVYRNRAKEIGWFPVNGISAEARSTYRFPRVFEAFHWHGETFDLPAGSFHLARTAGCENQAFQIGRSVVGLQFHLEATPETAVAMTSHCEAELVPAEYVQSKAAILGTEAGKYQAANDLMCNLLMYLLADKTA